VDVEPDRSNGGFATDYKIRNQGLALGWTHILSPSAVNQARYGYLRDNAHSDPIGLTPGQIQRCRLWPDRYSQSPFATGLPPIYISGLVTLGVDRFRPQFQVAQVFQLIDIFTKLQGNHSLMFGYEYHRSGFTFLDLQAPQGFIQSTGIYSKQVRLRLCRLPARRRRFGPSTTRRSQCITSSPATPSLGRTHGVLQEI